MSTIAGEQKKSSGTRKCNIFLHNYICFKFCDSYSMNIELLNFILNRIEKKNHNLKYFLHRSFVNIISLEEEKKQFDIVYNTLNKSSHISVKQKILFHFFSLSSLDLTKKKIYNGFDCQIII